LQVSSAKPSAEKPIHASRRVGDASYVGELRHALLDLHKALLSAQRIRYEREHGRVESSGKFLELVIRHPAFEWLRALSTLIARLDGWCDSAEGGKEEELAGLKQALRTLLRPEGRNRLFTAPYWMLVEAVPDVLVAHVRLWRLLAR
jgi:hypothetical protein